MVGNNKMRENIDIKIGNNKLQQVKQYRYLRGIIMEDN